MMEQLIHSPYPLVTPKNFRDLAKGLKGRLITDPKGNPLLTRYKLFGTLALPEDDDKSIPVSAFLHEFHGPDSDRNMHNHPWSWSVGTVLSGRLIEETGWLVKSDEGLKMLGPDERVSLPGDSNIFSGYDYHCIVEVKPDTWTLFITGQSTGEWGFWVDGKHIPWQVYCGQTL